MKKNFSTSSIIFSAFFVLFAFGAKAQKTLYVDAERPSNGDGASWVTAYKSLGDALIFAHQNSDYTTIKVAKGTYTPTRFPFGNAEMKGLNAQNKTFHIPSGVTMEGGYEASTGQRNIVKNSTTLKAIDMQYHVVVTTGSTTIDGFTITGGSARGSEFFVSVKGQIKDSRGGGIYAIGNVKILNNTIIGNTAGAGGGIYISSGNDCVINNNVIYNNSAASEGGGVYCYANDDKLSASFNNNTIYNNSASKNGGGVSVAGFVSLTNNIFWQNKNNGAANVDGADFHLFKPGKIGSFIVQNNLLQLESNKYSSYRLNDNNNIFAKDPMFISTTDGAINLRLQASSPCIKAGMMGNNISLNDITGKLYESDIDLGAYASSSDVFTSKIVPNVKLLPSGYASLKDTKTSFFNYFVDTTIHKFIGTVVYSDSINKKLGKELITKDSTWKDDNRSSRVKKLVIYCDSLVLNQNIWLAECEFEIQARVINMNTYNINSSALHWKKADDYSGITDDNKNGDEGGKGGNIKITCDKIIKTGQFIANGGNGASVLVPKVDVNYPGPSKRKITTSRYYRNCGGIDKRERAYEWNLDYDVIALVTYTKQDSKECEFYESYDDPKGIKFSIEDDKNSEIVDDLGKKRMEYKKYRPGKYGEPGKININCGVSLSTNSCNTIPGKTGIYIARNSNETNKRKFEINDVKISQRTYALENVRSFYSWLASSAIHTKLRTYQFPTDAAINEFKADFQKELADNSKQSKDTSKFVTVQQAPFYHPIEYLARKIGLLESQYYAYYQKNEAEKEALNDELDATIATMKRFVDTTNATIDDKTKQDYIAWYQKAIQLSNHKTRNIDQFGNVPGYRPMYSLLTTMQYMDSKNIDTDLELFVMADILANDEAQMKAFLEKADDLKDKLKEKYEGFMREIVEQNKVIDGLKSKAEICADSTEKIQKRLLGLEDSFKTQAISDEKTRKIWKVALKTGALACSLIPYGQPMLGQIGGSALNSIADNIDGTPEEIVGKTLANVDMSGVLKDMAKGNVKSIKPNSGDYIKNMSVSEKYKFDKEAYDKDVKDLNDKYTNNLKMTRGVLGSYMENSASATELDKIVAKMKEANPIFREVSQSLQVQIKLKEEIFSKLTDAVNKIAKAQSDITKNASSIYKLQRQQNQKAATYNPELQEVVSEIRNSALDRLKWAEYQMIKSYEYTTLLPFEAKMPASEMMQVYYGRKSKTMADVPNIVEEMKTAYIAQRRTMSQLILQDPNISKYRTDGGLDRHIILAQNATKSNPFLNQLNGNTKQVVLDLQNDFDNKIIRPNESSTRIKDIGLKIDFEEKTDASLTLSLEILDEGILRKGKDFYLFKSGDKTSVSDIITWNVNIENGNVSVLPTNPSEDYAELIKFLTTDDSGSKSRISSFSSYPAWSRCRVIIENNDTKKSMPKVNYLELDFKCEALLLASTNQENVLKVQTENAPSGILYSSTIKGQSRINHTCNYYTVLDNGASVQLAINQKDTSVANHFVKWQIYKGNDPEEKKEKEITVTLDKHTTVVAIFDDGKAKPMLAAIPMKKRIKLYESPKADAPILRVLDNLDECVLVTDTEKDGFQRVAYKGMIEGFIKQE